MNLKGILTALLSISLTTATFATERKTDPKWLSEWHYIVEDQGVSGQCRQHVSKINQCRLVTTIDADLTAITALLLDGDAVSSWAPNTLSSESLARNHASHEVTVYATYAFPGARNRDAVTYSIAEQNTQTGVVKIKFHSLNIQGPKTDLRLVRFPLIAGSWTLTPLGKGQTRVEHLNLSLPGGVVQDNLYMLYNLGLKDASFDTLHALRQAVQRDEYRSAKLDFIRDF